MAVAKDGAEATRTRVRTSSRLRLNHLTRTSRPRRRSNSPIQSTKRSTKRWTSTSRRLRLVRCETSLVEIPRPVAALTGSSTAARVVRHLLFGALNNGNGITGDAPRFGASLRQCTPHWPSYWGNGSCPNPSPHSPCQARASAWFHHPQFTSVSGCLNAQEAAWWAGGGGGGGGGQKTW